MKKINLIFLLFMCLLASKQLFAQTTLIESFDYSIGSLKNQGTATNGWGGAWTSTAGTANIIDGNFGGDTGRKLKTSYNPEEDSGGWVRYVRNLPERWTDNGQTIWVSFYMKCSYPGVPRFAQLAFIDLNDGGTVTTPFIIGVSGSTAGLIGINDGIRSDVSDKQLNYILAKIELDGNTDRTSETDRVSFWVNYFGSTAPETSTAAATKLVKFGGWDQLRITSHVDYTTEWDKIRISNTFAPESSSLKNNSFEFNSFDIQYIKKSNQLKLSVAADEIVVTDVQGRVVLNAKGNLVDVSMLNKGLYIVKANYQGKSTVKKVLKD
jgi:hypothetical protein